jgi:hypothetical protein
MGQITDALKKVGLTTRDQIAEELKRISDVPSTAEVHQLVSFILGQPGLALSPKMKEAFSMVRLFASGLGRIEFTHLQRTRIAFQLIARILKPALINQGTFGMCGPASIAIDAATHDPDQYAAFAISLAEKGTGTIGHITATPVPSILNYPLIESTISGMPQADWIVLASLRDDPTTLQDSLQKDTYGGTTGSDIFNWMKKCGFQKVIHMSHLTFANTVEFHPVGLLPPTIGIGDRFKTLETAAELTQKGWRLFMSAFMQLSKSIEKYHQISTIEGAVGAVAVQPQKDKEYEALIEENPGHLGTLFGALKKGMGFDGGDSRHWTLVESLVVNKLANTITITCCNHGIHYQHVCLPLDGFTNKFIAFVAVTDYG